MKTNIFYLYENREYPLAEREQLGDLFGWCNLEYAEEIAKEKFGDEGFGSWEIDLPNGKCISVSIEREVDDEDDSEVLVVMGDTDGVFADLTLSLVEC